ncbi:TIGR00282 family metallophosphoesterase [Alphaproteobacteria bacterium]|nr:TIGR00282 family metallophosphoesterase [Alphaproteobacteria bacterium]
MNFLMIGDVVGRVGRNALRSSLSEIKKKFEIDFTIINAENSAAGFGLTPKIYEELIGMGANAITLGNHAWDKIEIIDYMKNNPNHSIIRPLNFVNDSPGKGYKIFDHANGKKILVCQVHTKLFINLNLNDPFYSLDTEIISLLEAGKADYSFLEVHGEATSEKNGIGQHYDGKFTGIYGTHTHIPTADARILSKGTAFKTDIGMTGDYDSIIGMKKESAIKRMRTGMNSNRLEPAENEATISGIVIKKESDLDIASIKSILIGGTLNREEF